ncbi:unnamed protein product [Heligmosomoides polygyrus]|uniref:AAA_6 domain-containing protein n=1 Tax=Heligmosomoides polygyrus TaxID=6339 RepID=A0A183GUH8_HELPZ|nr:unnamed protein product [Heligmosomoides polygyrus]
MGRPVLIDNIDRLTDGFLPDLTDRPCYKELSFVIPSEFISIGTLPKKTYDLGTIDLAGYKDQSTVCL